ncbi:MAG: 2Fe-2S iron-sulfur cluster-binding protein [Acidiferrobacterales bacterium]|nr:2Fe-2S iron-sulfur cluster-binding protein [Acidiferrobacterales bacterium]
MNQQMLDVEIWRGGMSGHYNSYQVPIQARQTILDIVTYVQRELDSTLSYRFSCRVGMCGTCAMTVNGVPRWTCRTQTSVISSRSGIRIAPLRNFPVIKDLVVDMNDFFEKWDRGMGASDQEYSDSGQFAQVRPDSAQRKAVDQAIECIGCGVCHAACDVVGWNPQYLGPAALNRTWSLANDERQQNRKALLQWSATESGCLSCHTTRSCTTCCPKELDPSGSIAGLKQQIVRSLI